MLLYLTKNTLRGGRQWPVSPLPPTQKVVIGSFTFYVDVLEQLRGSGPPSASYTAAWGFLYLSSRMFHKLKFVNT